MRQRESHQPDHADPRRPLPAARRRRAVPGKHTRTEQAARPLQRKAGRPLGGSEDVALTLAEREPQPYDLGSGEPLPADVRLKMERAFNADFSSVRTFQGGHVAARGALAYTQGHEIHFAPGRYDPHSQRGQELLGHELTHVLQQAQGRVAPTRQAKGLSLNDDSSLEHEADTQGQRAARGEIVHTGAATCARPTGASPAQRKIGVALVTDDTDVDVDKITIENVLIAGRPKHIDFKRKKGKTEGDHTTAWAVMRLTVLNRLVGQKLGGAGKIMDQLVAEARALPGAQNDRIAAMEQERSKVAAEAGQEIDKRKKEVAGQKDATRLASTLQRYIADYLTFRNAIGLTVMNLGGAAGDGEATLLKVLEYWETHWDDKVVPTDVQKDDIVTALGALFSPKVVENINAADPETVPGVKKRETKKQILFALTQQHGASIKSAFPTIWQNLKLKATNLTLGKPWNGQLPDEAKDIVTGQPFAVQLEMNAQKKVETVHSSGRPKHGTAGELEGDHTSAYVLSTRAIERCVKGFNLATATTKLLALEAVYRGLPGAEPARVERMNESRIIHFNEADKMLKAASADAGAKSTLSTVQRYASALLYFRNSLGLVVVAADGGSKGKAEGKQIADLERAQDLLEKGAKKITELEVMDPVCRLFDRGAIEKYSRATTHIRDLVKGDPRIQNMVMRREDECGPELSPVDRNTMEVESYSVENFATQDALYDLPQDEQRANGRKDPCPGYDVADSIQSVTTAVLTQHLRSIKMVAPHVIKTINDGMCTYLVQTLAGSVRLEVNEVSTKLKQDVPLCASLADRLNKKADLAAKRKKSASSGDDSDEYNG